MRKILIIADDLTGAAEIGGIAAEFGIESRIAFGRIFGANQGALAVDTDTRSLSAAAAAAKLNEILAGVDPNQFDLIYKKTDSVLRGNVAAEIETVLKLFKLTRAILIPQNPSRGRTIENGEYRINGVPLNQTTFANDSEHPARSAKVTEILGVSREISIGEGSNEADIRRWASRLDANILPTGGADFFTAILQSRGLSEKSPPAIVKQPGKLLVVLGSASASSREFVAGITQKICPMPDALFDPASRNRAARKQWVKNICDELSASHLAFIAIRQNQIPDRARYLREAMAAVVAETLGNCGVDNLLIEGGATAAAIVRWMGWREFKIVGHFAPGVVAFRNESARTPLIVIKPGSYPWPVDAFTFGNAD